MRIPSGFSGWAAGLLHRVRPLRGIFAQSWRKVLRTLLVCLGFAVYLGAQFGIGYAISADRAALLSIVLFTMGMLLASAIWPIVGLVVLIVVTPLAQGFLGVSGGGLPDIGFEAVMVPALALFILYRTLAKRDEGTKLNIPICLIMLYVVYSAANLWFRGSVSLNTYRGIVQYTGFWPLAYLIVLGAVRNERHVRAVLISLVALAFAQGVALIIEHFTGYAYLSLFYGRAIPLAALGWGDIGVGRSVGLFSNPVGPSVFLAASVAIAVHLARLTKVKMAKVIYLLVIAVICLGAFYTYTRNVYIMLALTPLLMLVLAARSRPVYGLMVLVGFVVIAGLSPAWMEDRQFNDRITNVGNIDARLGMNRTAMVMIRNNLWFGVGWRNYTSRVREYYTSVAEQKGMIDRTTRKAIPSTVHNTYLIVLAENGLVGAVLYFGALLGFFALMWRSWRRAKPNDGLLGRDLLAIFVLFMVLLFMQFAAYSSYDPTVNVLTWIILGLGVRSFQLYDKAATAGRVEAA